MRILLLTLFAATTLLGNFFHLEPAGAQELRREQYMTPAVPADIEDFAQCSAEEHSENASITPLPCPTESCVVETQELHHTVDTVYREEPVTLQETAVAFALPMPTPEDVLVTDETNLPPAFIPTVILRV